MNSQTNNLISSGLQEYLLNGDHTDDSRCLHGITDTDGFCVECGIEVVP